MRYCRENSEEIEPDKNARAFSNEQLQQIEKIKAETIDHLEEIIEWFEISKPEE